jgi:putative Flp pilus-assembly TadE/G-like protein
MRPAFISTKRSGVKRHGERGVTMALVAVAMVAIIAMAALSIDLVTLYLANGEAQRSADAAALAAARVLSLTGMTGDPNNTSSQWTNICGTGNNLATDVAKAVAGQNVVSGLSPLASQVDVSYAAGGISNTDCAAVGAAAFGVNPTVTVKVHRTGLPTFFSRIWSQSPGTVSATATAEAFNSSNSSNVRNDAGTGQTIPVLPRCVKPWVVPNIDPGNCPGGTCTTFVSTTDGSITHPGIQFGGTSGVIGDRFNMVADCQPSGLCAEPGHLAGQPAANVGTAPIPNLQYVPAQVTSPFTAVPSCASTDYQQAIAGCDQNKQYQCGVTSSPGNPTVIDVGQNNVPPDTLAGAECLINKIPDVGGQDTLDTTTAFPYRIQVGDNGVLKKAGVPKDTIVTSSSSIVTVPIFDSANSISGTGQSSVTIVGFLQVFINDVDDTSGNLDVTVLNVAGCGNGAPPVNPNPVAGNSPVIVRLIQKYP